MSETYRITRETEADCEWCGGPLYVGDTAVFSGDEKVFCNVGCVSREAASRAPQTACGAVDHTSGTVCALDPGHNGYHDGPGQ